MEPSSVAQETRQASTPTTTLVRGLSLLDAILLLAPKRAGDEALQAALKPLLGRIDIEDMREANLRASGNDAAASPNAVARWLREKIAGR